MITLILLPGLDGTGQLFADFITCLGTDVETIVVSYPTDTPLGYAELQPIAHSFLPKDKPFYLLAESFSGPIAISLAASSPPGLLGLILCCSFARNPLPLLSPCRPAIKVVPVAALPIALLSFFVLGRFSSPLLREQLAKSLALISPSVLRIRALAALSIDASALLSCIKVPVLYLRASKDRIVRPSSSELIASLAPNVKISEHSAPHFLLQVAPAQAASSVAEFMKYHSEH